MKKMILSILSTLGVLAVTTMVIAAGGPPAVTSNLQKLGMHLYNDKNLSLDKNQSCRTCHHHLAGFADLKNHLNPYTSVVSTGSDGVSKGGRNAPTSAYAGFSPPLAQVGDGEYEGGLFWDGRAAGNSLSLADPLAEQAQGPPLNPVEMAMSDKAAIVEVIKNSSYVNLWYKEFGNNSLYDEDAAYDNFARAVAAYERSADVTKFNSKFDLYLANKAQLTPAEARGFTLFVAHCDRCHSTVAAFDAPAPLFTNYRYSNIGVPANPLVPLDSADLGLGAIVGDDLQNGKFKVPTLRNIAMSAPYAHNGSFPTLEEMVNFVNNSSGFTPEVIENIDPSVGNLSLLPAEVNDIIAFLHTLTDDY
ncbi:c-type cytochrome [Desulfopila sp. IMCC35006]|uniref:cytochrome-c peroxidase n=1 Tax=Desulfopila sp. IMCC35006 TaxID=2569542 RepID=UPI0010ACDF4B|nr:cytochrome c peroxidase [Desulfopila sp. IMCC35006]TKB24654.1 c-type cytochrome [Desulfopila sp. IMCC35006]